MTNTAQQAQFALVMLRKLQASEVEVVTGVSLVKDTGVDPPDYSLTLETRSLGDIFREMGISF